MTAVRRRIDLATPTPRIEWRDYCVSLGLCAVCGEIPEVEVHVFEYRRTVFLSCHDSDVSYELLGFDSRLVLPSPFADEAKPAAFEPKLRRIGV